MSFQPKIEIKSGLIPGYGGPGLYWTKGVYDNRLLFYVKSTSESSTAIRGERERIKWERKWPSQAKFLVAISKKKLDTPLCSNCGGPKATSFCLDKYWCEKPGCRQALEEARTQYRRHTEERKTQEEAARKRETAQRIAEADATCTGFHWRDGWYFKRTASGAVRIVHRETPQSEWLETDITIPPAEWASIVCSVSGLGETSERWDAAQDFHGRS